MITTITILNQYDNHKVIISLQCAHVQSLGLVDGAG